MGKKKKSEKERVQELLTVLKHADQCVQLNPDKDFAETILECLLVKVKREERTPVAYWKAVQPRFIMNACVMGSIASKRIASDNIIPLEYYILAAFIPKKPAAISRFSDEGAVVFAAHCIIPPDL